MDLWGQLNLLFITGKNGCGLGNWELKLLLQCQKIQTELYCTGQTEPLLHHEYWTVTLIYTSKAQIFFFLFSTESLFCNMVKWAHENDKWHEEYQLFNKRESLPLKTTKTKSTWTKNYLVLLRCRPQLKKTTYTSSTIIHTFFFLLITRAGIFWHRLLTWVVTVVDTSFLQIWVTSPVVSDRLDVLGGYGQSCW